MCYSMNEKATEASLIISYRVTQIDESHTITKKLIKSCTIDMISEKAAKQLSSVLFSNGSSHWRLGSLCQERITSSP